MGDAATVAGIAADHARDPSPALIPKTLLPRR
jgi:hypothetical protein